MKELIISACYFFILPTIGNAQTFYDLGGASATPNQSETYQLVPTTFSTAKVQVMIRASELTAAGIASGTYITGISYYIGTDKTSGTITADFYADHSTSSFTSTSFLPSPTLRGSITDVGTINNAWRNVTFTNPLQWNGTSNILIQMCRTSGGLGVSDFAGYMLTTGFNSSITGYFNQTCASVAGTYVQTFRPRIGVTVQTTLPVTWGVLSCKKSNNSVVLSWSTLSEQNTKDFQVEQSINGKDWTHIGTIRATGNSAREIMYYFTHLNPSKGKRNFYRIKQQDLDNKFSYSKVIGIDLTENKSSFAFYPNPTKDMLVLITTEEQDVRLLDYNGKIVWERSIVPGRTEIPVKKLTKGTYVLQTKNGNKQVLIH